MFSGEPMKLKNIDEYIDKESFITIEEQFKGWNNE
jgi:hypothetical protein